MLSSQVTLSGGSDLSTTLERLRDALADRYRVERELGHGGMATVYLAEDLKHRRRVAIKVIHPELAAAIGPDRFLREIEIAAQLNHPHILPLFDSGAADGQLYYVMPYIEGESLRARMDREGQLAIEDALRLAGEIASALGHAHHHEIVHRDIKPENVLLSGGIALVADFGIARAMGSPSNQAMTRTDTIAGTLLGTPRYMSPEQVSGGGDGRTDLYALACVLYEMLAGQPPFVAPTTEGLIRQHLTVEARPVTDLRPSVPSGVAAAITKAMAKLPVDRHATAVEFAEALALRESAAPSRSLHERTAIAVLPFQNLSAQGPHAYFAGGLHDELLTQLAKVAALKVISRTSVMGYAGTSKLLKQIANELGVGSVVEGSVQVVGERLRVNVQLIDAATDEHLWAERYDRTLDDAFGIQSEVAQQIVAAVAQLTPQELQNIAHARPVSPKGYELYLRGLDAYRRWDKRSHQAAIEFLKQAIKEDSTYAPAWAAIGAVYIDNPGQFGAHDEEVTRARKAVERALTLDPDLAFAHSVKAQIGIQQDWNWAQAERDFKRAIELSPSLFEAHHFYSHLLMNLGRVDESLEQSRSALALDPLNTAATLHMGWHYLFSGEFAHAIAQYETTLRLDPSYSIAYLQLVWAYVLTGRHDEAAAAGRKYVALSGDSDSLWVSAIIAARRGRTEEARSLLTKLIDGVSRGEQRSFDVAAVFAQLGRKDDAFQWLDRAITKREEGVTSIKLDPFLTSLHSDPRFAALLNRVGLRE